MRKTVNLKEATGCATPKPERSVLRTPNPNTAERMAGTSPEGSDLFGTSHKPRMEIEGVRSWKKRKKLRNPRLRAYKL